MPHQRYERRLPPESQIEECTPAVMALRESENNFRALAENANDGIILIAGKGKFVYANKRFAKISGYSVSTLLKYGINKLVHPAEKSLMWKRFRRRMAGERVPHHYEASLVHKSGRVVPIEVSGSRTTWYGKPAALIIIRDITQRKLMEEQLREANDELERRVDQRTLELMEAVGALETKQRELQHHKSELEKANRQLAETNKALAILARNLEHERIAAEKKIAATARSRMLPIIKELQKDRIFEKHRAELDELLAALNALTAHLKNSGGKMASLSPCEFRIAAMIKNGLTSPQIAALLHICLDTVKTHRRNIRKKIGITNSKKNLASYLQANME